MSHYFVFYHFQHPSFGVINIALPMKTNPLEPFALVYGDTQFSSCCTWKKRNKGMVKMPWGCALDIKFQNIISFVSLCEKCPLFLWNMKWLYYFPWIELRIYLSLHFPWNMILTSPPPKPFTTLLRVETCANFRGLK